MRLVSLRLRQKDELLDRGRVRVPFALFLWSLRAWALISTGRQRGGARERTRRESEGHEGGEQVENNKKEQKDEAEQVEREKLRTQKKRKAKSGKQKQSS